MNISTNKTMSFICWPLIKICEWMGRNTPETLVKIRFYAKFRRLPRLDNPVDLNEKILWMKLHADVSKWSELADKYKVRSYLEKMGLSQYMVKLYGKWDDVESIDFSKLPENLIFKVNNGDGKGTNEIVKNLSKANKARLVKLFKKWLSRKNVGDLSAEPQYKMMPPCIIAEELLPIPEGGHSLVDYKIWCINGEPLFIWTCSDRDEDGGGADVMTYDLDWNAHPEFAVFTNEYRHGKLLPQPENLEEMLVLAKKLSQGFPILRVDLYNIEGKIFFGELTFTSQGGMMDFYTQDFLDLLGKRANISDIKKVR
ncbi:MAG: ATP-grasp fold amidoligase family protein [Bacteroidales bacterium]|nr:ATP-grasp fold amidoligase family protein [Bacteroidales bacterium]